MKFGKLQPQGEVEFDGYQELMNWTVPTVDSYTKCLLHFDGTDGAVATTEETGKAVTFVGTAQLDTAQKVFGSASLLLDGDSDYITLADSDDWYFADGDFTVDCWIKLAATGGTNYIYSQMPADGTGGATMFSITSDGTVSFRILDAGNNDIVFLITEGTIADTNWHHIAVVRNGNTGRIFIDGVSQTLTTSTCSGTAANIARVLEIGRLGGKYNINYFNGWIDEFRISKGIARWTSNFTPPISAYEDVFSSVSLTVDGDTDMEYVIEARNLDANDRVGLRLNNDSTAGIYGLQYLQNNAGTITAARATEAVMYITDDLGRGSLTISTIKGFTKFLLHNVSGYTSGTTIPTLRLFGRVYNSTSNITSLDFLSESGNFTAGTNIRVLGRKSQ